MSNIFYYDPVSKCYTNGLIDLEISPNERKRKSDEDQGYVKICGGNVVAHTDSDRSLGGEIVVRLDQSHTSRHMDRNDSETVLRLDFQGLCRALDEQVNVDTAGSVSALAIEDTALGYFNHLRMDEPREVSLRDLTTLGHQARQLQRIQGQSTGRKTRYYNSDSGNGMNLNQLQKLEQAEKLLVGMSGREASEALQRIRDAKFQLTGRNDEMDRLQARNDQARENRVRRISQNGKNSFR